MTIRNWGPVRACMRTNVTKVDGRTDVLTALKLMKKAKATSLIVERRDEHDGKAGSNGPSGHGNSILRAALRELWH